MRGITVIRGIPKSGCVESQYTVEVCYGKRVGIPPAEMSDGLRMHPRVTAMRIVAPAHGLVKLLIPGSQVRLDVPTVQAGSLGVRGGLLRCGRCQVEKPSFCAPCSERLLFMTHFRRRYLACNEKTRFFRSRYRDSNTHGNFSSIFFGAVA